MGTVDWSDCPLVEVIPGKVSRAPLLNNTRLPVDAITGNYDAFLDEGLSPDAAPVHSSPNNKDCQFSLRPLPRA